MLFPMRTNILRINLKWKDDFPVTYYIKIHMNVFNISTYNGISYVYMHVYIHIYACIGLY